VGARILYVPHYHPEMNPMEHAWSKLNALLKKGGTRASLPREPCLQRATL